MSAVYALVELMRNLYNGLEETKIVSLGVIFSIFILKSGYK
jgi:hypothetical protein